MNNEKVKRPSFEEDWENEVMKFHFLNGDIELDCSKYGAYAIDPGCGAGKTTLIKELIKYRWMEGILYVAATIKELDEMYEYCKSLVESGFEYVDENGKLVSTVELKLDDILVLHSDYSKDGTDKRLWQNNPKDIAKKKIVLCTQSKLLNEPFHLLVDYEFMDDLYITPTEKVMKGLAGKLPRQWILIDEITEAKSIKFKVKRSFLLNASLCEEIVTRVDPDDEESDIKSISYERKHVTFKEFKSRMKYLSNSNKEFNILRTEFNELDKLRNEQLMQVLYNRYNFYLNIDTVEPDVTVTCSFTDLIFSGMKSHLILFDGTSGITLKSSKIFDLIEIDDKYNVKPEMTLLPFQLNRRIKTPKGINDINLYIKDALSLSLDKLEAFIKKHNRTLIFSWMDLKLDNSGEINDDFVCDLPDNDNIGTVKDIKVISSNSNFSFTRMIVSELKERGLTEGVQYSIEYYGSGLDKATNKYREYDCVVLFGKYTVPGSVISDFNIMYHTNITGTEYYLNRMVQAICRTRIRNHDKDQNISIAITTDWSSEVINELKKYLGIDSIQGSSSLDSSSNIDIDYMTRRIRSLRIPPKKANQIAKLGTLDKGIYEAVLAGETYSARISLNEIYSIIPMSRKDLDKYKNLTTWIKKYGIDLIIYN